MDALNRPAASATPEGDADLDRQAWAWVQLLTSGDARERDLQRFQAWARASEAHRHAFNEARRRRDAIAPAAGALLAADAGAASAHARALRGPAMSRRAFVGLAAGAAATAGAAGVAVLRPPLGLWPGVREWSADYRTRTGEQRALQWDGRVQIVLNTQTSIRHAAEGGPRAGIELIAGEAAIDLPPAGPPFSVAAGAGVTVAEAGRFEVRYLGGQVCVTCLDGSVRIRHPSGERALPAGRQRVYDDRVLGEDRPVDVDAATAWRGGELVFRQTRLADAIDEINRYRPGRVVLVNAAVRDEQVTGRFAIASLDLALLQIQRGFGLQARTLPAGVLLLG